MSETVSPLSINNNADYASKPLDVRQDRVIVRLELLLASPEAQIRISGIVSA
jgi:hypothetical protein